MSSASLTDGAEIALHTFQDIAKRLGESIDGCSTVAEACARAPTSAIACNILLKLRLFTKSVASGGGLKHQLKPASNGAEVQLVVHHVQALTSDQHASLRQSSARIHTIRFVFRALDTALPLAYGCLIFTIKPTPLAGADEWRALHRAPAQRQRMRATPDWTLSVVRASDRALILQLLEDVYNMADFIPTEMRVSLEPIEDVDYQARTAASRKRGALASETDDESAARGSLIGYALHFTGMPSFDDSFLAHLAQKYDSRWLGFALIFPHTRQRTPLAEPVLVPQRIVIKLTAETALVGAATQTAALKGARRLTRKLAAVRS